MRMEKGWKEWRYDEQEGWDSRCRNGWVDGQVMSPINIDNDKVTDHLTIIDDKQQ